MRDFGLIIMHARGRYHNNHSARLAKDCQGPWISTAPKDSRWSWKPRVDPHFARISHSTFFPRTCASRSYVSFWKLTGNNDTTLDSPASSTFPGRIVDHLSFSYLKKREQVALSGSTSLHIKPRASVLVLGVPASASWLKWLKPDLVERRIHGHCGWLARS